MMDIDEKEMRERFGEYLTLIDPEDYDYGIEDLEDEIWFGDRFYVEGIDDA